MTEASSVLRLADLWGRVMLFTCVKQRVSHVKNAESHVRVHAAQGRREAQLPVKLRVERARGFHMLFNLVWIELSQTVSCVGNGSIGSGRQDSVGLT